MCLYIINIKRKRKGRPLWQWSRADFNTQITYLDHDRYSMALHGMIWYGMVWYRMTWYSIVWYGIVWYGIIWHGIVWYGMVFFMYVVVSCSRPWPCVLSFPYWALVFIFWHQAERWVRVCCMSKLADIVLHKKYNVAQLGKNIYRLTLGKQVKYWSVQVKTSTLFAPQQVEILRSLVHFNMWGKWKIGVWTKC